MRATALVALSLLLAACGSPSSTAGTPSPTPTQATSPSPAPSAVASPSPVPTPTPSPIASPTPSCTFPVQGGTASRATIVDVRVGAHAGYDRLVIEYTGGQPTFKLVPQNPATFVGPYSGQPVKVAGDAGIHLFIYGMDVPPTFPHGMNLKPAYDELKQVVVMAVFEGQADIAIGLDRLECPTASLFSAPNRLVIDFPAS